MNINPAVKPAFKPAFKKSPIMKCFIVSAILSGCSRTANYGMSQICDKNNLEKAYVCTPRYYEGTFTRWPDEKDAQGNVIVVSGWPKPDTRRIRQGLLDKANNRMRLTYVGTEATTAIQLY